jgi:hypothetical protein
LLHLGHFERGQGALAGLAGLSPGLAAEAQALQASYLALTFGASGVTYWQAGDQLRDPVAQLEREMGRRGAHQTAHFLYGHLPLAAGAGRGAGILGLTHADAQGSRPAPKLPKRGQNSAISM